MPAGYVVLSMIIILTHVDTFFNVINAYAIHKTGYFECEG